MINSAFAAVNGDTYPYRKAFYSFESGTRDTYVNGYNNTNNGVISYAAALNGGNFSVGPFNDTNFLGMNTTLVTALNNSTMWSMEFYTKFNAPVGFAQLVANSSNQFSLTVSANGLRWNNGVVGQITGGSMSAATVYHTAWVNNGTNRLIYLNGVLVASDANSVAWGNVTTDIGKSTAAPNFYYDGVIDNMKICFYPSSGVVPTKFPTNF